MINIRNLAIIAHVDHGKTTMVDAMFKQGGLFRDNQNVVKCAMDSNAIERERGITILAKCTSFIWNDVKLNIVDTPGHADFGGEVERILSMVDGVLVLVDSAEGPMPQTKFVLLKALSLGLNPIVLINKVDKQDARVDEVLNEIFDLFVDLNANEKQLDFPVLYSSGRHGWAVENLNDPRVDLSPLLNKVINFVPEPKIEFTDDKFRLLVTMLDYDQYVGRILTGRIQSGKIKTNEFVHILNQEGEVGRARLSKIFSFEGLRKVPLEEASVGDIVAIAGLTEATVADTICDLTVDTALKAVNIDPPTLSMTFSVNDSPLAGKEGSKVTSRVIGDRLYKEAEGNVSIKVKTSANNESFEVFGRGELQLGILIETMRREGFELSIGRPKVLFQKCPETNVNLEPIEEILIDTDDEFTGIVIEKMTTRKGNLIEMKQFHGGKTRLKFLVPTRGLIGYHGDFLTDTRGTGIMNRLFHGYEAYRGPMDGRNRGVLVSTCGGTSIPYALFFIEDRGYLFISSGEDVYEGMIIGENAKDNDLAVNPIKEKQLTNMRASGKDENIKLTPPRRLTLEQAISYIQDDELVEVTPKNIRIRKKYLESTMRKRMSRSGENS